MKFRDFLSGGFAIAGLALGIVAFTHVFVEVHAAPIAKYQEPGCVALGTVGTVTIVRCVTEQGDVIFANSAGFMQVKP
jgi:hypothetical protein